MHNNSPPKITSIRKDIMTSSSQGCFTRKTVYIPYINGFMKVSFFVNGKSVDIWGYTREEARHKATQAIRTAYMAIL